MKFKVLVISLLLGICAGLSYELYDVETRASRWAAYVESAENIDNVNMKILEAHEYGANLSLLSSRLGEVVALQADRERKVGEYALALEEENIKLKEALKQSIVNLDKQLQEFNDALQTIEKLTFQVQTLQDALKTVKPPTETATIKQINDTINIVNTAVNVLQILL